MVHINQHLVYAMVHTSLFYNWEYLFSEGLSFYHLCNNLQLFYFYIYQKAFPHTNQKGLHHLCRL